ncbi:hypothetical protein ANOM_009342 [Aspergillus nomiae NRRL 13137]|uniref:Uncharacterized protein n=1 Tax=Aspergillus nomiae NRRL (strain ATCC 15546 / NRRL 13137 / CBS 260.88 / M93) TaxID=1509407 RepID=A0A0L1IW83_ASPN3|nr:uncharacterized protein ANOM_009342 [Aspergillus nomiae NRRL 13137]KNG83826.1 hypothetical protein ANOM_009342 [Aspergillus nomiae NRRL 13137]
MGLTDDNTILRSVIGIAVQLLGCSPCRWRSMGNVDGGQGGGLLMVVDKKWEAVRIAMLCDASKKTRSSLRRSETPWADLESDAAEAFPALMVTKARATKVSPKTSGADGLLGSGWVGGTASTVVVMIMLLLANAYGFA